MTGIVVLVGIIGMPGAHTGTPAAVPSTAVAKFKATPAVVDGDCIAATVVVEVVDGMVSTSAKNG